MGNQLLNRKKSSPLPPHTCSQSLALLFSKFFHSKINNICSGFTPDVTTPLPDETSMILCSFKQTTAEEIQRILQSIPPKSCDLDPIPTSLLKDCMSTFATIIAEIVNLSFPQKKSTKKSTNQVTKIKDDGLFHFGSPNHRVCCSCGGIPTPKETSTRSRWSSEGQQDSSVVGTTIHQA